MFDVKLVKFTSYSVDNVSTYFYIIRLHGRTESWKSRGTCGSFSSRQTFPTTKIRDRPTLLDCCALLLYIYCSKLESSATMHVAKSQQYYVPSLEHHSDRLYTDLCRITKCYMFALSILRTMISGLRRKRLWTTNVSNVGPVVGSPHAFNDVPLTVLRCDSFNCTSFWKRRR